jgi:hypothetical protein
VDTGAKRPRAEDCLSPNQMTKVGTSKHSLPQIVKRAPSHRYGEKGTKAVQVSRGHRPVALLDEPWDNQNHEAPDNVSGHLLIILQVEGATRRIAYPPSNTLRAYIPLRSDRSRRTPPLPSPSSWTPAASPTPKSPICSSTPCAQETLALAINHISGAVANDEGLQYEQGARHHQEAAHL